MATKSKSSLLIGAKIIIDYPNRWQGAKDEATRQQLRAEAEASKNDMDGHGAHYFGEAGTVVAYNHTPESGKDYEVLLGSTGEIVSLHSSWFTVREIPQPETEVCKLLTQQVDLLKQLLDAFKQSEAAR